jgi:hypothetical protein
MNETNPERGFEPLTDRLTDERPVPSVTFRVTLRCRLTDTAPSTPPRRVRLLIAAYAGSGVALLGLAAVGLAGIGPFGLG